MSGHFDYNLCYAVPSLVPIPIMRECSGPQLFAALIRFKNMYVYNIVCLAFAPQCFSETGGMGLVVPIDGGSISLLWNFSEL